MSSLLRQKFLTLGYKIKIIYFSKSPRVLNDLTSHNGHRLVYGYGINRFSLIGISFWSPANVDTYSELVSKLHVHSIPFYYYNTAQLFVEKDQISPSSCTFLSSRSVSATVIQLYTSCSNGKPISNFPYLPWP